MKRHVRHPDEESEDSIKKHLLADPDVRKKVADAALSCLEAVRSFSSGGEVHHEPDFATRLKAAQWITSYTDGLPAQLTVHEVRRPQPENEIQAELERSPAVREAMRRVIDQAEQRARGGEIVVSSEPDLPV